MTCSNHACACYDRTIYLYCNGGFLFCVVCYVYLILYYIQDSTLCNECDAYNALLQLYWAYVACMQDIFQYTHTHTYVYVYTCTYSSCIPSNMFTL